MELIVSVLVLVLATIGLYGALWMAPMRWTRRMTAKLEAIAAETTRRSAELAITAIQRADAKDGDTFVMISPRRLTPEAHEQLCKAWNKMMGEHRNIRVVVLEDGMKVQMVIGAAQEASTERRGQGTEGATPNAVTHGDGVSDGKANGVPQG